MKDVSQVTAMVVDLGLFVENARILGKKMKKVYYCNPSWVDSFPKMNDALIGTGFPEIEVVTSPFDHFDDVDLFCFFDVGHGRLQTYLESVGKAVWGCKMGENLEFDRVLMKKLMAKKGLPVGPYKAVKGTEALREYLRDNKDQYVKISKYRGAFETFKSKNYASVEPRLDEIEMQLGAFKKQAEFVVEEELKDKFEVAIDSYNIDGKLPTTSLLGVEVKDKGYVGKSTRYSDMPDCLKMFDEKMAPVFEQYGFRSFYSPETRVGEDQVPFMIDLCPRSPSPPNELYQVFYKNLAEIIWKGANGECIDPEPADKWGAEILIHSAWACDNWQPIEFPKEVAEFVKIRNAVKIDGKMYCMPQTGKMPEIGAVVGYGGTMKAAMDMAYEIAAQVEGHYIEIPKESLDEAKVEIAKAIEYGVWPR